MASPTWRPFCLGLNVLIQVKCGELHTLFGKPDLSEIRSDHIQICIEDKITPFSTICIVTDDNIIKCLLLKGMTKLHSYSEQYVRTFIMLNNNI